MITVLFYFSVVSNKNHHQIVRVQINFILLFIIEEYLFSLYFDFDALSSLQTACVQDFYLHSLFFYQLFLYPVKRKDYAVLLVRIKLIQSSIIFRSGRSKGRYYLYILY